MAKGANTKLMPPPHRAVIHRPTGKIIGPVVPIDPQDWPYRELPPFEILWRYMDFWKLEDMLTRSALYFSRPDQFKDPFEGRFSLGNATTMSASDAAFYAAYRMEPLNKQLEAGQEIMRRVVFISCWQRGSKESREMWDAYTSGPESVVISTSAKALYLFVDGQIVKSPVKYHGDSFPRTEFDHTTLFFYKPALYRFEHEFRMLLTPGEHESIRGDEVGRRVPIRLKKIVRRVITHPKASEEFKVKVDHLLEQFLRRIKREDSALLP
jgi:hypothetical protein